MKYPLTADAKSAAKLLVEWWDKGQIPQNFGFGLASIELGMEQYPLHGYESPSFNNIEFRLIGKSKWKELSLFNLISFEMAESYCEVVLLQELRNAVATDFEVSEYFLTLNAVGNIIINSTTGNVQGMGINTGIANMTIEEVANTLESALGAEFLAQQQALKEAIDSLRTSFESDKQSKLGKVISELGNCLQHGANAHTVIQGMATLASAVRPLLGP